MFKRSMFSMAALLAMSLSNQAQAQESKAPEAQNLERVQVTGSRTKTVNVETPSQVISVNAEAIKIEAQRDVEGLLNNLPSVFADQGGQVSNGASGTATVNLRNLGSGRTLVLVNGRRLPAGSPRDLSADLNQVPVSLIKRVDVLTGGASAVYGSDAISGVVNFIMNDRFQGLELEVNHQFFNHQQKGALDAAINARNFALPGNITADAKSTDFSLTAGSNLAGDKGNITVFIGHKRQNPLLESQRDFSACALNPGDTLSCGGSGTSYPGRFYDAFASGNSYTVADANGGVRAYSGTADVYNYAPLNYLQRPSDRYTAAVYANYNVSEKAKAYVEFNFHDDHTVAQIAPSGAFGLDATLHYENPLLSQAWKDTFNADGTFSKAGDAHELLIFRRNVEGGGRRDDARHTSYRGVLGVKGDINASWSYDVSLQAGKVLFQETYFNDMSNTRLQRALDVVTDPKTGAAVCRSKLDGTDPNCVPYNIWKLGGVVPEALSYLQTPGFQRGSTEQTIGTASVSGDLTGYGVKTPWAHSGLGLVVGAERRKEKLSLETDSAFSTGDLAGQGGPTIGVGGAYSVTDVFSELQLPIIEDQTLAKSLVAKASYRRSDYSLGQKTNTYGLGLQWVPVNEIQLRASYQQATRAPNIVELFRTQSLGLYDADADPCSGATPAASLAACQNTGVTAAQYGKITESPAGQYNQISGGSTSLKPETAKSVTFGVVLQPLKNLTASIDYFNIKVKDLISTVGSPVILQQCLDTGNPIFCSLIHRDNIGSLWAQNSAYIVNTSLNIGGTKTSGIDLAADYSLALDAYGKLSFSFVGTKLSKFHVDNGPGLPSYDCAGLYGNTCGIPLPIWRHRLRSTWDLPSGLSLSLTWRHINKVDVETSSSDSDLAGNVLALGRVLGARDYLDLAASYRVSKNLMVRASVANLLDRDPPLRSNGTGFVNGNTYPVVYDAMGRRVTLNATLTF